MEKSIYGYARIFPGSSGSNQMRKLQEYGVCEDKLYVDIRTGKEYNRPEYRRLLERLKSGDTLVISSVDTLGKTPEDMLAQWKHITKEKKAAIVVLDMPHLNTEQKAKDLSAAVISDVVLQVLEHVVQSEQREYLRKRQAEGIAAAKANGVRFGRPSFERPEAFPMLCSAWKNNEISARHAAKQLGISHKTFILWANES